jgi:uncharacterized protein YuzE
MFILSRQKMVSVDFDSEVNAMYIRLKKGKVDSSEPLADNVIVDVNKKGVAIGIEILLPERDLRIRDFVSKAFKIGA